MIKDLCVIPINIKNKPMKKNSHFNRPVFKLSQLKGTSQNPGRYRWDLECDQLRQYCQLHSYRYFGSEHLADWPLTEESL